MMRKITTLFTMLILAITLTFANENPSDVNAPGALTGRVVDESGYVLPGTTVTIEGTTIVLLLMLTGFSVLMVSGMVIIR